MLRRFGNISGGAVALSVALSLALVACGGTPPPVVDTDPFPSALKGKTLADFQRDLGSDTKSVLVIHYYRPDGQYDKWNIWSWVDSLPGAAFVMKDAATTAAKFRKTVAIPYKVAGVKRGFIVRKGEWEAKDIDQDRTVTIPSDTNLAEIWVVSGQKEFYTKASDIDLTSKLQTAFIDKVNQIKIGFTLAPTQVAASDFEVMVGGQKVAVTNASSNSLTLAQDVTDPSQAITVKYKSGNPVNAIVRDALNDNRFFYDGGDLGATYTPASTTFKVWSPVASEVAVQLFDTATATMPSKSISLSKQAQGVWSGTEQGDLHGKFYRLRVKSYGLDRFTPDPYSKAASHYTGDQDYGQSKSMVIDLARTNPVGWNALQQPKIAKRTDATVYEMHIRDFTINANAGVSEAKRGKYLGVIEAGTKVAGGVAATGLDYLKQLGVNAVQFLPMYDYGNASPTAYNWGYDPHLFNVPEGRYSSNPNDSVQTSNEMKQMVMGLNKAGISVIMDVVYNHTKDVGERSPFDQVVPYYYYRTDDSGAYLNDTGVGNVVATERPMVRQFVVDSLKYWVSEYKVQGFRFDLMGTFDLEALRIINSEMQKLGVIMYGEPWAGFTAPRFNKNDQKGPDNGVFNDSIRGAVIGNVSNLGHLGFHQGDTRDFDNAKIANAVKVGLMGALAQPVAGVAKIGDYQNFAVDPGESTNYATSHDNFALWDRISLGDNRSLPLATHKRMQRLAAGLVLSSQGLVFLHGGDEFGRTKQAGQTIDPNQIPDFVHNSYNDYPLNGVTGDQINQFDWVRAQDFKDVSDYYAGMIAVRKAHPVLRLATGNEVRSRMSFLDLDGAKNLVGFVLNGDGVVGETAKKLLVAFNGSKTENQTITLPAGDWKVLVNGDTAGTTTLSTANGSVTLPALTTFVAFQD
jgi:pullulanase